MSAEPIQHRFTADEYERMADAGLFPDGRRMELLGGEILEMSSIGSRHAACVDRLTHLLVVSVGGRAIVRVQSPVRLSDVSEVRPDVALLRPRQDFYALRHPAPEDVLLAVEVSDVSVRWDRTVKRPLYAAAGVAEMWIVDLGAGVMDVATRPGPDGYQRIRSAGRGGILEPAALPGLTVAVVDVLA